MVIMVYRIYHKGMRCPYNGLHLYGNNDNDFDSSEIGLHSSLSSEDAQNSYFELSFDRKQKLIINQIDITITNDRREEILICLQRLFSELYTRPCTEGG